MPSRFVEIAAAPGAAFLFEKKDWDLFSTPNVTLPKLNQTTVDALAPDSITFHAFALGLALLVFERAWVWISTRRFLAEYGDVKEKLS